MSEFLIDEDEKPPDIPTKETLKQKKDRNQFKKTQRELYGPPRQEIKDKIIKMFRAACNGKNYYKKWFPELKDTGDFEVAFVKEVNKLK